MHQWLHRIDQHFPVRYTVWWLCGAGLLLGSFTWVAFGMGGGLALLCLFLVLLGWRDTRQTRHSVLRNYPVIGHLRFLLEFIRPEMRQYFIESDNEAAPFSRQQRSLVYQRAKGDPDKRPFGTQLDVRATGYEWINHSMAPTHVPSHDFRIHIGGPDCTQPYAASVFNISAMSFGALSANAIQALNAGAKRGGFAHDTGEGSISRWHRVHGGDLIWEIGSGYFGCRRADGSFDPQSFTANAADPQVKMVEVKLSQGAKPGHGGVLPGPKVTPEIAEARGVPVGQDCVSPASHSAFSTPLELMTFIAQLRQLSGGKPVGFKLCIGHPWEWFAIVKAMLETGITPDFIVDEDSAPYPSGGDYTIEQLQAEGYPALLRIERGRVRNREVFGPMRLDYGFFKLQARQTSYFLARSGGQIVGAVGYTMDPVERTVRVFELISLADDVVRFLLAELERKCREELGIDYIEIDVSAYAPRMQRTLLELNFLPVAYVPAMVFYQVERLDVVGTGLGFEIGGELFGQRGAQGVVGREVLRGGHEHFRIRVLVALDCDRELDRPVGAIGSPQALLPRSGRRRSRRRS